MKRHLVLALGLALVSTSVFATRARLESLNLGKDGSFFVEDGRNIFLNAAHVNHIKDSIILEWGDTQDYDSESNSDAEGGYFKSHGKFTYGVYFGRQADSINSLRNPTGLSFDANSNNVDFYFGGDADGVEWGAALSYSSSENETNTSEQNAMALRLGAVFGATEAWLNTSLANDAENGTTQELDGKIGVQAGVSHGFGHGYRGYAQYRTNGADYIVSGTTTESDFNEITLGLGKTTALNDNANMFSRVQIQQQALEVGTTTDTESLTLNAIVGLEADVKEWLTVRGSVSHTLWGETENKIANTTNSAAESTEVAGGASIKLSDLSIDGSVGKQGNDTVSRLGISYNF